MTRSYGRRGVLLGGAALLAGCDTIDNIFGEKKRPLQGERLPVLGSRRSLEADPALAGRAVTLPEPAPIASWPVIGGNAAHAPGHALLEGNLREVWRSGFGSGTGRRQRMVAGPVLSADLAVVGDAFGIVSGFDPATGAQRWRRDTRPEEDDAGNIGAGSVIDGNTVYVTTGLAEVLALDVATGEIRWRARLPAPARGGPAFAAGRLFVPTIENQLVAVSAEDGRRLWTHRAPPTPAVPFGLPTPAIEGETVVAGFASGELTGLRATDGRVLWSEGLGGSGRGGLSDFSGIRGLPVIHEDWVFASSLAGTTLALDLRSGRRIWERNLGSTETPAVAGDWLFLVSQTGDLVALGRGDGRVRWILPLDPAPAGEEKDWQAASFTAPILAGGRIIVPGSKGQALLVDPAAGVVTGQLRLPGGVTLPGAVVNSTLYLATDDASLVAYRG
ncbi:outer membrane protein assembly factor BamB [Humitalea rosea]|uniref:Outer membrane protein assembly factor BamB n=1 Tax=Humitalea rosea TaxID=990373 RepID=A0A2W7IS54_9PROT|nr:PQQ-binding-like beta-propeller repeat protein [Humitalea rosea]PZW50431.1 outer membrane protein assembly factor BamB [Humitalea rosea]